MHDAVTEAGVGLLLLDKSIGVNNPIYSAVAHGVGSDRDAILVEEADHLSINRGIDLRVAAITCAGTCHVWSRGVAQPIVVDPAGAGPPRAVHEDFDSAGEQVVVAESGRQTGNGVDFSQRLAGRLQRRSGAPEHADAFFELALIKERLIGIPVDLVY